LLVSGAITVRRSSRARRTLVATADQMTDGVARNPGPPARTTGRLTLLVAGRMMEE
jgi:hypothetical protein